MNKVLVILGPTCVGKTQVSLNVADILNGEIVSFDSRQIYKYLDIGTAKPTKEEREKIPHHLIDLIPPDHNFTAADYSKIARRIINRINERGKQPIVVGGSGLYLKALIDGFFQGPTAELKIRERLQWEVQEFGEIHLYNRLKEVDPKAAQRIHPHDMVRIIRALEVFELTGKPITVCQLEGKNETFPMDFIKIGLTMERVKLYEKINKRVDEMIAGGLLEEVRSLKEKGYTPDLKALNTVGYKELFSYLEGELNIRAAIEMIKLNSRHYAKRQMTWFGKDEEIIWLDAGEEALTDRILEYFIKTDI